MSVRQRKAGTPEKDPSTNLHARYESSSPPSPTRSSFWKKRKWSPASLLAVSLLVSSSCSLLFSLSCTLFPSKGFQGKQIQEQPVKLLNGTAPQQQQSLRRGREPYGFNATSKYGEVSFNKSRPETPLAMPESPMKRITHTPRVFFVDGEWNVSDVERKPRSFELPENEPTEEPYVDDVPHDDGCQPLGEWQIKSFPSCNTVHEIDLHGAAEKPKHHDHRHETLQHELTPLGEGWFRTTWKLNDVNRNEETVLKTLRVVREFLPEYFELHRRDAVALERLTRSEFVLDIYGFCGQSAINEIASFPYGGVKSLEDFNSRMKGNTDQRALQIKLRIAASIALGLADIHAAGLVDETDGVTASMVHYDLNPRNVALVEGGRPKINDFNIAEFLRYDPKNNRTCGFLSRLHEPWWRAPEEMNMNGTTIVDEKVDVYALGNIIHSILTSHSPRGKMKKERMESVRADVAKGIRPVLYEPFLRDTNPMTAAMKKAMDLCFVADPKERASAAEVAGLLIEALVKVPDVKSEVNVTSISLHPPAEVDDSEDPDDSGEAKG